MFIKKRANSLITKTLLYLIVFSITILLFLWIFQIVFLNIFYEKYQIKELNNIAHEISGFKYDNLENELEKIASKKNVCIEIIDKNYVATGINTNRPECMLGKSNKVISLQEIKMINLSKKINTIKLENDYYNVSSLLVSVKIGNNTVFLYSVLEDVNNTSIVLKNQLIYITLIVIILACLIAYFISYKLNQPIINLTKKAKELEKGNYDLQLDYSDIKEINELDIALNNAAQELSKIEELRNDLMANISHDLKTPLTMIKAYAEKIKDFPTTSKELRNKDLDIIISETDRLNTLVNDVLDLSKLQANAQILTINRFDLAKVIKDTVHKFDILLENEKYIFNLNIPKKAMVIADESKIIQVIYNLVNNAVNYTGKDKMVTINIIENEKQYLVEIIDTGKGISEKDIKYIWEKYYKSNKNYQRSKVGSGIGLSIVKQILVQHDLKYGVDNKQKKGTKFYFYINKS